MRESYAVGDSVLVFDTQSNRSRAEAGEPGAVMAARPATVQEDVTPHGARWDPFGDPARRSGAYVDAGPQGPAVYQVLFTDGNAPGIGSADVHRLAVPSEIAAAFNRRAEASAAHAQAFRSEAAKHQAEADRMYAAAKAIQQGGSK